MLSKESIIRIVGTVYSIFLYRLAMLNMSILIVMSSGSTHTHSTTIGWPKLSLFVLNLAYLVFSELQRSLLYLSILLSGLLTMIIKNRLLHLI